MVLDIGIEVKSRLRPPRPQIGRKLSFAAAFTALLAAGDAAAVDQPAFHSAVVRIGPAMASRMTSWHPDCPVATRDLRLVTVSYWGFDGRVHDGRLVVGR